jgi:hypothetical protein
MKLRRREFFAKLLWAPRIFRVHYDLLRFDNGRVESARVAFDLMLVYLRVK